MVSAFYASIRLDSQTLQIDAQLKAVMETRSFNPQEQITDQHSLLNVYKAMLAQLSVTGEGLEKTLIGIVNSGNEIISELRHLRDMTQSVKTSLTCWLKSGRSCQDVRSGSASVHATERDIYPAILRRFPPLLEAQSYFRNGGVEVIRENIKYMSSKEYGTKDQPIKLTLQFFGKE